MFEDILNSSKDREFAKELKIAKYTFKKHIGRDPSIFEISKIIEDVRKRVYD